MKLTRRLPMPPEPVNRKAEKSTDASTDTSELRTEPSLVNTTIMAVRTAFIQLSPSLLQGIRDLAPKRRRAQVRYVILAALLVVVTALGVDRTTRSFIVDKGHAFAARFGDSPAAQVASPAAAEPKTGVPAIAPPAIAPPVIASPPVPPAAVAPPATVTPLAATPAAAAHNPPSKPLAAPRRSPRGAAKAPRGPTSPVAGASKGDDGF